MTRERTLRRRIVVALVAFTTTVCLAYCALAFLFVYLVEDEFFATLLANEAGYIERENAARPRLPFVQLHRDWESVPADLRKGARSRNAREVAGDDGRHYHLRRITLDGRDAWLVAEVSSLLVVRPMRSTLLTILIPATLVVLIGSSIVAVLVARRSVRQLTALVDAVERETPFPRDAETDREVRVLADALDAAFARVNALLQREKAFVGDVSHELRTPIAVIRGAAELLERRELDPTAHAQIGRIRESARSSEEIIELLLALAREETAHEPPVQLPLLALVEKLVVRHRGDADVHIDIAPQLRVTAPPLAAEVVISNLISNALRHGGGRVEITARGKTLRVEDRQSCLSEPGTGRIACPPLQGRGIGLNLVRRLCAISGFQLAFESTDAGTAASVVFAREV